jgi:hypothetical protein
MKVANCVAIDAIDSLMTLYGPHSTQLNMTSQNSLGIVTPATNFGLGFRPMSELTCSSIEQKMKIKLGSTQVTAKSDGGLSLYPSVSSCSFPVFCLEVYLSSQC